MCPSLRPIYLSSPISLLFGFPIRRQQKLAGLSLPHSLPHYLEDERVTAAHEIPVCWTYPNSLISETPTTEVLSSLGVKMEWEECVSQVTAVQHQLREK